MNSFSQVFYVSCYSNQSIGERITDLFRVGDDDVFAVPQDDMSRYANNSGIIWNIPEHNRASANSGVISHLDVA